MDEPLFHLLTLPSIRERSSIVYKKAQAGKLSSFILHEDKLPVAADYVANLIKRDFGPSSYGTIPPHGRWQHFEVHSKPRVSDLLSKWEAAGIDKTECTRRLIDLFVVSVLLDAGAGDTWAYTEEGSGLKAGRSEGLAVASFYMFIGGQFSAQEEKCIVNGSKLEQLTTETLAKGMQVGPENEMVGLEGRAALLQRLGKSLKEQAAVFGADARPGGLVDYLLANSTDSTIDVRTLWAALQRLLLPIWPSTRTKVHGVALGDAWPLSTLVDSFDPPIQPFHKLTQWLTYSLMVPFTRVLEKTWTNSHLLTGLPEYRNGGLFVDLGILSLQPAVLEKGLAASGSSLPSFAAEDDVIVEWRALTVALLDAIYPLVVAKLNEGRSEDEKVTLSMAQMLEAGSWKAGRELAAEHRPESKCSPILVQSDGTVF